VNLLSPTKAIRIAREGEPFVSHWEAKNLASNFLREGVKGTTRNAFLVFQDTGESHRVTVGTITERPHGRPLPNFDDRSPAQIFVDSLTDAIETCRSEDAENTISIALRAVRDAARKAFEV